MCHALVASWTLLVAPKCPLVALVRHCLTSLVLLVSTKMPTSSTSKVYFTLLYLTYIQGLRATVQMHKTIVYVVAFVDGLECC